jgi:DNA-binding response OmpR family regulator
MSSILLVEDAKDFQVLVSTLLGDHRVTVTDDPDQVSDLLHQQPFDLILLDLTLPKRDGYSVLSEIQLDANFRDIPVICLTGKTAITDKVTAFSLGADDYIQKPFDVLEFKARIESKLKKKRKASETKNLIKISQLVIDLPAHRVYGKDNKDIQMTQTEFKILVALSRNIGQVFSREQLIGNVWGDEGAVFDRAVDVHVCSLRKKLLLHGINFKSITGVGYKLIINDMTPRIAL